MSGTLCPDERWPSPTHETRVRFLSRIDLNSYCYCPPCPHPSPKTVPHWKRLAPKVLLDTPPTRRALLTKAPSLVRPSRCCGVFLGFMSSVQVNARSSTVYWLAETVSA